MKTISLSSLTILAFALASCGGQPETNLDQLKAQRDSLQKVKTEISAELLAVEEKINELDTTRRARVVTITTEQVKPARFSHFFEIQGEVETDQNAQLFPEASGTVISIPVKEGQEVSKGQLLLSIDSKIITSNIEEVENRLQLAKTVFEKQKSLWDQNIGSEIQFLEAKNNYEALQQNLESLKAQRALYNITAPFSGIVDEITLKEGEMASPAMPAIRLINMDGAYIKADVSEGYLGKIKAGDSVKVVFPSIDRTILTTIERVGNFINPNNRTFKARIELDDSRGLRPNLLGEVLVRDYVADSAIAVPSRLIQQNPDGEEFVFSISQDEKGNSIAKKVMVTTGISYEGSTEITSGLSGTEILINKGSRTVKEGDQVEIAE